MTDESRLKEMRRLAELRATSDDVSQGPTEVGIYCTLHPECEALKEFLTLKWQQRSYHCSGQAETGSLRSLISKLESRRGEVRVEPAEEEAEPAC